MRRPKLSTATVRDVFERDHGVCVFCGIDCEELRSAFDKMTPEERGFFGEAIGIPPERRRLGNRLWDIDHIKPLAIGGKSHLRNLRTLCIPCHASITRIFNEAQAVLKRRQAATAQLERERTAAFPKQNRNVCPHRRVVFVSRASGLRRCRDCGLRAYRKIKKGKK